jgi:DNA-binding transcriptional LysR family regulator
VRLRQIEYFVTVCDSGTFTAAASRLYVAQPSLSQQVRALELELGACLMERSRHGIELTPAGRVFLSASRSILAQVESAKQCVRDVVSGEGGDLHVLTVRSVASGVLPPSVVHWRAKYPGSCLRMHDFSHRRDLEDAMLLGRGDIAVGPRPADWSGPVVSLGYEELRIVSKDSHNSEEWVDTSELANAEWVAFEPEQGMSEVLDRLASVLGFTPHVVARTGQVEAAVQLAMEGIGLAVVPENAVHSSSSSRMRTIGKFGFFRELVAYTRTTPSQLTQLYVDLLTDVGLPLTGSAAIPQEAIRM